MRKIIGVVMAIMLCGGLQMQASAVQAKGAIVIDADTQQVLFEEHADMQLPMASTTKIMTALVAIEHYDLQRVYTVKREYTLVEGSSMYLQEGEQLSLQETLYGLMLQSGNDAALAIAGECGGLEEFVAQMNDTATRLGLQNTHFDNPNGLDSQTHYTTASDLARLTAYALHNDTFREIVGAKTYQTPTRYMKNHNKLLSMYPDAIGVKTGYTKKSGRCLVSAAKQQGRTLVVVTLNDPDDWKDHMDLYAQCFAQYQTVTLHQQGEQLRVQCVVAGLAEQSLLETATTVSAFLTQQDIKQIHAVFYGSRFTYAPVVAGQVWGTVRWQVGDAVLAQDTLCFAQTVAVQPVEKSMPARLWAYIIGKGA